MTAEVDDTYINGNAYTIDKLNLEGDKSNLSCEGQSPKNINIFTHKNY